ncbi:putative integral membrane protein [Diaporthe ampelina]|uniref:Putative integral membrane protein n=1 Tax=Diaporthe ampelina TaxID=1214573 RepID=A0A0G2FW95_9PEZI|nr:putative integral membrane protein [Diaporthe ampelina]
MLFPLSALQSWPTPNYANPERRGPAATIVVAVLLGLVTLILIVRIYTRVRISRGFGLDDVLIILAYVPTTAFAVLSFIAMWKFGWGTHVWDLRIELTKPSLQFSLANQLLFDLATSLTKLSMLSLIYRVVSADKSRYRYVVLALAAVVLSDGMIFFFITTFQCRPVSDYWTLSFTPQKCINEELHLLAAGCINTTTDFLIVILPIPYVVRLKLPRKQQIIIVSLFTGGLFVTAAGAVRTYVFHITLTDPTRDVTWNAFVIIIVSALELYIGIVSYLSEKVTSGKTRNSSSAQQICASIPAIKPFIAHYLPIMLESPRYWLSKQTESRRDPFDRPPAGGKGLEPDFWLVTERDSTFTFQDVESASGLVLQMQPRPPMPGMPTPTRPPRTASTLQTGAALSTIATNTAATTTADDDHTSVVSAVSAVPAPLRVAKSPRASTASSRPDLNKPLPRIGTVVLDASFANEGAAQKHMSSVYQFIPHEDGHISVHKARKSAFGNG